MVLTKSFADLVQSRAAREPEFAAALLHVGIGTMLAGDVDTGKTTAGHLEPGGAKNAIKTPTSPT